MIFSKKSKIVKCNEKRVFQNKMLNCIMATQKKKHIKTETKNITNFISVEQVNNGEWSLTRHFQSKQIYITAIQMYVTIDSIIDRKENRETYITNKQAIVCKTPWITFPFFFCSTTFALHRNILRHLQTRNTKKQRERRRKQKKPVNRNLFFCSFISIWLG